MESTKHTKGSRPKKKPVVKINNFAFEHEGEEYWWSRSVACVVYLFCKNNMGEWCVLADKRGPGCPTNVGKWCVPCGYLDCNEGIPNAAAREVFEETGIGIEPDKLTLFRIDDAPHGKFQNVSISFVAILPGTVSDYRTTSRHSEKDEVDDIRFIRLWELNCFDWAFGQREVIDQLIATNFKTAGVEFTSRKGFTGSKFDKCVDSVAAKVKGCYATTMPAIKKGWDGFVEWILS